MRLLGLLEGMPFFRVPAAAAMFGLVGTVATPRTAAVATLEVVGGRVDQQAVLEVVVRRLRCGRGLVVRHIQTRPMP